MAASYPSSKKTFSQIIDGTTKVKAAGVNVVYDEVEALETMVGAIGSAQSYSESFKNLVLAYRRGGEVEYKGAADLYVRSGEITVPDASGNARLRRNASDTTVTWANTDVDSPEANGRQYYVYATADDSETTFDVAISTNNSAPAGFTYYKKIGSFYNDASGNITNVCNVFKNYELSTVYDYGTSASSPTTRTGCALKVCYGAVAVAQGGSTAITNLPFLSSASYAVTIGPAEATPSTSLTVVTQVKKDSASQCTIYNKDGDSGTITVQWIAIGV